MDVEGRLRSALEAVRAPLDRPGHAHHCRVDRAFSHQAADTFSLASRRVVRFAVVYSVVVAVVSGLGFAGYAAVGSGATDPTALARRCPS
jgi:hypothetical protein